MPQMKLGVVGCGELFNSQHRSAIDDQNSLKLIATADPHTDPQIGHVEHYSGVEQLLAAKEIQLSAVVICTPSAFHLSIAKKVLRVGKSVILEKPPTRNLSEIRELKALAEQKGVALITLWHSQHAPGVRAAAGQLSGRKIKKIDIYWHEDFYHYHPGQTWVTGKVAGGIFDPLVNALSIVELLINGDVKLISGSANKPQNWEAAISGKYKYAPRDGRKIAINADVGWHAGGQSHWDIKVTTVNGTVVELTDGGANYYLNGQSQPTGATREYLQAYHHVKECLVSGQSDIILGPLQYLVDGQREDKVTFTQVAAFPVNNPAGN